MLTAGKLVAQGRGLSAVLLERAAMVALDWDVRQKSRFEACDSRGRRLAVFLPRGQVVRGGDVLVAEDGSLLRVEAAAQPVLVVRAPDSPAAGFTLMRAAYHLGNRHVPLELQPDRLLFEPDTVLQAMLLRMGLQVEAAHVPFEPEGGAYRSVAHGHAHGHAHGRAHEHEHEHEHARGCEHKLQHVPAHDCGRDHDKDDSQQGLELGLALAHEPGHRSAPEHRYECERRQGRDREASGDCGELP